MHSHREPSTHECQPLQMQDGTGIHAKNAKARALLDKHFPASQSTGTSTKTTTQKLTDPKKLTQLRKVQLLKMRHKAKPGDSRDKPGSVGVAERLHLQVYIEDNTASEPFWFRKVRQYILFSSRRMLKIYSQTTITGRAIDLLASQFGMSSATKVCLSTCLVGSAF